MLAQAPNNVPGASICTTDLLCFWQLGETRLAARSEDNVQVTRARMTPALNREGGPKFLYF